MSDDRTRSARFALTVGLEAPAAFAFVSDVARLNEVTPPWFRLDAAGGPPTRVEAGSRIDYRFTWRRLPMSWRSHITVWEPPRYFVYEQEHGPYRLFRHEHLFEPVPGGTRVIDVVHFRTAFGALVDRWLVEPDLERVFAFRRKHAETRFPVDAGEALPEAALTAAAAGPTLETQTVE